MRNKYLSWIRIAVEVLVLSLVVLIAVPQAQTTLNRAFGWATTGRMTFSGTAPTISSGFGTSPTIQANGTTAFRVIVGTGSSTTGVIGMPTATNAWICSVLSIGNGAYTRMTTSTQTTVTVANFGTATGTQVVWVAGDLLTFQCSAY